MIRWIVAILAGIGAAAAQETPKAEEPKEPEKTASEAFRGRLRVEVRRGETPKVCAIPLLNVLPQAKPGQFRMPIVRPAPNRKYHIKEVQVPAPSCDDVK